MLICQKCNTPNPDDNLFCERCGRKLYNQPPLPFTGKDYTNQSINANLFKGAYNSIGGKIYFYCDYMKFKSHILNSEQVDFNIRYEEIANLELIGFYLNLISNGLQVTTKSGDIFKFVVWHRQEIKDFLDYKVFKKNR